jgi:hypothetical protein
VRWLLVGCEACLVFSDCYWKWRLAGSSSLPITLVSDSQEVRRLLGEEDAKEEEIDRFVHEPHAKEEGRRRVKNTVQHPDA